MESKEKKERKVTPMGLAKWAHLTTPKQYIDKGKPMGEPKYCIDVVFDPKDPAWAAWAKNLQDSIKKMGGTLSPIKKEYDQNDEETGNLYAVFKTSDKVQPRAFDKHGVLLENIKIGNGSKVRVSYIENEYKAFGGGINLYLNAVQVLELVEYSSYNAAGYGFEVEQTEAELDTEVTFP